MEWAIFAAPHPCRVGTLQPMPQHASCCYHRSPLAQAGVQGILAGL
jgi:hypothetical protein